MNVSFCGVVQSTLIVLDLLSKVQCNPIEPSPIILARKCQSNISNEFNNEFNRMINIMKENISTHITKQIYQFNLQPDYNYISYFKYNIEFVASFILNRIEKAFEEINYDHFFSSITDCNICDHKNQTSRTCLKDLKFKENFIKSSIQMFSEYPLEVERKKFEIIDKFKKKNDVNIFTNLYSKFLDLFNDADYFELEMRNMIRNRINYCCSIDKIDYKINKTINDVNRTDFNLKIEHNKIIKNKQQLTNNKISSKSLGATEKRVQFDLSENDQIEEEERKGRERPKGSANKQPSDQLANTLET